MTHAALTFVTDFADQAVLLPVAAVVLAALALLGWRRAALAWALGTACSLAAIVVFKLVVMACGPGGSAGLLSPSGHTAGAAAIYGGAAGLLVAGRRAGTAAAAAVAAVVAAAIGLTRLGLGVHTAADVWAGGALGVAAAGTIRALAGPRPDGLAPLRLTAAAVVAAMLLSHGHRLDAEPRLRWAAARLWPLSLCRTPDAADGRRGFDHRPG